MCTVRIGTPEVGQCSGILIGPQRRDTETLARLSVLIRRRAHNFRIARRTGVAHLGVIGKREHRIQEPP